MENSMDFNINKWTITTSTPLRRKSEPGYTYSPANDSGYPESIVESSTIDYDTPDYRIKATNNIPRCRLCDKLSCTCDSEFNSVLWENAPSYEDPSFGCDSLEESSCSASQLSDNFNSFGLNNFLQHFSPREPDRLIGRKMGLEKVDILSEMENRNISSVSRILDYLEPIDLCRTYNVCHRWRSILRSNGKARARRRRFLNISKSKTESAGKENAPKMLKLSKGRLLTSGKILTSIQYCQTTPRVPEHSVNSFEHAASALRSDESLRHCPNCQCVAKTYPVQDRGVCLNDKCAFDFCIRCFSSHHGSKKCVVLSPRKSRPESVGSAKSKKNLRRL